jgi:hypothetical protein
MVIRTLLWGTGICVALFLFFRLFLKNNTKTGVFITLVLLGFFNYGVVYEWMENSYYAGSWPFHNIHRYLICIYLAYFTVILIVLIRLKKDLSSFNFFLNGLVGFLLVYNFADIIVLSCREKPVVASASKTVVNSKPSAELPDIYIIILDGYANGNVLKKYYNYDNTPFLNHLKEKGFYVADSSFANYYYTSASLASSLNLDYPAPDAQQHTLIKSNTLFRELKSRGYEIINLKSGYSVTSEFDDADYTIPLAGPNEFERTIMKYTILRLDDLLGLFSYMRLTNQFARIDWVFQYKARPKCCFLHIVAPHPPFVMNKNGSFRINKSYTENSWEPKQSYLDQLTYLNTRIEFFADKILEQSAGRPPIISIQSDHGPWIRSNNPDEIAQARMMILNAAYVPENKRRRFYPAISSVNTFRILSDSSLNATVKLLPDLKPGEKALRKDPSFTKRITP